MVAAPLPAWGYGIAFTAMLVAPLVASVILPLFGMKVNW
jgi:hypothetical protein